MHPLTNAIIDYYAKLESLIYLRPELEPRITWVARLLKALDEYLFLFEAKQYMELCRLMAFKHDYSQSVAFVTAHLTEVLLHPNATPEHRLCVETLLTLCQQCVEQALELYAESERCVAAISSSMPFNGEHAFNELSRGRAALWKFQYMFNLGQGKPDGPNTLQAGPMQFNMPFIIDQVPSPPMGTNMPSPIRFAFSQAYAARGVGKYGDQLEMPQGNAKPEKSGPVSLDRRFIPRRQPPATRKAQPRKLTRSRGYGFVEYNGEKPLWAQILSRSVSGISKARPSQTSGTRPGHIGRRPTIPSILEGTGSNLGRVSFSLPGNTTEIPNLAEIVITSPSMRTFLESQSPPSSPFASSAMSSARPSPVFSGQSLSNDPTPLTSGSSSRRGSPRGGYLPSSSIDQTGRLSVPEAQAEGEPPQKKVRFVEEVTGAVPNGEVSKARSDAMDRILHFVHRIVGLRHDDSALRLPLENFDIDLDSEESTPRAFSDEQLAKVKSAEQEFRISALAHWYSLVKHIKKARQDKVHANLLSTNRWEQASFLFPRNTTIEPADVQEACRALAGHEPNLANLASSFRHNEDALLLYGRLLASERAATKAPPHPADLEQMMLFLTCLENYITLGDARAKVSVRLMWSVREVQLGDWPLQFGDLQEGYEQACDALEEWEHRGRPERRGDEPGPGDAPEKLAWFQESMRLWRLGQRPPAVEKKFVYVDLEKRIMVQRYREDMQRQIDALGLPIRTQWDEVTRVHNILLESYNEVDRCIK